MIKNNDMKETKKFTPGNHCYTCEIELTRDQKKNLRKSIVEDEKKI